MQPFEHNSDRLQFLAQLPMLLNSSLGIERVIEASLQHVRQILCAEAATVFLLDDSGQQLTFWALRGGVEKQLEGKKMAADKGIVGWVITNQQSVFVTDAQRDPRFFRLIDQEAGFQTRDMLCAPLIVRGNVRLGAIEVMNSLSTPFCESDCDFLSQFANQLALAIDNARLFTTLRDRNTKLETLNRRKDEVISVIAHEFRTPLSIIQGSAEMIGVGQLDRGTIDSLVDSLDQGVRRLTKIVSQIRNISQVSQESLKIYRSKILIQPLLQTAQELFSKARHKRQLELSIENYTAAETAVTGDTALLLIALRNLVSNGFRFTPDGGKVQLRVTAQFGLVTFEVIDTGIGIDPSQLPLIFEKFFEVTDAAQHSSGELEFRSCGLGLGLATTKAILAAHGTNIEVESAPNQGSTFRFSLPLS